MIRKFHTRDTESLVSIWRAASAVGHPFLEDRFLAQEAENLRAVYLPNAETWVAESRGVPVGFIALIGDEIGGHGKGIGKAMVDHAVALKGLLCVEVFEKNTIGRRFYDQYGFVETARFRHEATGELMLKMAISVR